VAPTGSDQLKRKSLPADEPASCQPSTCDESELRSIDPVKPGYKLRTVRLSVLPLEIVAVIVGRSKPAVRAPAAGMLVVSTPPAAIV
jgi:hypothetical protein